MKGLIERMRQSAVGQIVTMILVVSMFGMLMAYYAYLAVHIDVLLGLAAFLGNRNPQMLVLVLGAAHFIVIAILFDIARRAVEWAVPDD